MGSPVQLPRPSEGKYVLGPLLSHDARWRRYRESRPQEVERDLEDKS